MTISGLPSANKALHLADLAKANADRCNEVFHGIEDWTPTDWACAMGGECGEALNLVKKLRRLAPDFNPHDVTLTESTLALVRRAGFEIADMVIYADLLCQKLGLSLEDLIREKFNAVSERVGSDIRL